MRTRCLNPNAAAYKRYGAKGVTVAPEWDSFERFLADVGERPPGTTLDRIDGTLGYAPGNCRWATATEQAANRCWSISLTYEGETLPLAEWARRFDLCPSLLRARVTRLGWDVGRALTTRPRSR